MSKVPKPVVSAESDRKKIQNIKVDNFPSVVRELLGEDGFLQLSNIASRDQQIYANCLLDAVAIGSLVLFDTVKTRLLLSRGVGGANLNTVAGSVGGINFTEKSAESEVEKERD